MLQEIRAVIDNHRQKSAAIADHFLETLHTLESSLLSPDELSKRRRLITDDYWRRVDETEKAHTQQIVLLMQQALRQGISYAQWHVFFRQATARPNP